MYKLNLSHPVPGDAVNVSLVQLVISWQEKGASSVDWNVVHSAALDLGKCITYQKMYFHKIEKHATSYNNLMSCIVKRLIT